MKKLESESLFKIPADKVPLAERMRPQILDDVVGQNHLIGSGKPLSLLLEAKKLPSIIFWGPPGTGKTTIARILSKGSGSYFRQISAVLSGVADLRKIIEEANNKLATGESTLLFVDEIHRWNKAQQDALLPHIENGTITMIGSTTENPSFEVIGPLLSRTKVYVINPLSVSDTQIILKRTLEDTDRGLGNTKLKLSNDALEFIASTADGDARRSIMTLEISADVANQRKSKTIELRDAESALQKKALLYDKKGEEHYNIISAFIKSMRGSDPNAAVYYLARMLEAGEDPLFTARRMVIFASEDVGNADPQAVQVAISCMESFNFIGMPEGWIPLAQCATYLASAPKSNASYMSYKFAKADVLETGQLPTPMHIRNAPTKLMKNLGYGKNYRYPHDEEGHHAKGVSYLPDSLKGKKYYKPTENGYERIIKERLEKLKK